MLVDVEPGSKLAGYRVERVLATGGMGTVYLVHDPILPRLDALKVMDAGRSKDAGLRARFIRESDTGARMHHPNIVSIYSRGEAEDGSMWIAMQYVAGTDAEAALRSGTINPSRALRIIREIAKALDYAHRLNVVHNDVKPSNFLLGTDTDGDDEQVLLSDFGISRVVGQSGSSGEDLSLTLSLAYAAPEVIVGDAVTGRADIYSLGCTLFRLLTGKQAFSQAAGTSGLVEAHLSQAPPRISDFLSGTSPQLDAVITKALAKDPDQRFHSARELAEAATDALHHTIPPRVTPSRTTTPGNIAGALPANKGTPTSPATSSSPPRPVGGNWPPIPASQRSPGGWVSSAGPPRTFDPSAQRGAPAVSKRVLLVGAAVIAAVVALIVALNQPSPAPPPSASEPPPSTASPPPLADPQAQARLTQVLPSGYPPGVCTPGGITSRSTAVALCGPNGDPGGPTSATYTLARDISSLHTAMDEVVHSATAIVCPPNILSPGPWHRVETPTVPVGVVFCGTRAGKAVVAWTNEPELLLCVTRADTDGPPLDQLFTWWTSHS